MPQLKGLSLSRNALFLSLIHIYKDRTRVSLGLKQLGQDPWVAIAENHPVNSKLTGKVTNLTDYGCFVEILDGVEGLVHVDVYKRQMFSWCGRGVLFNARFAC